MRTMPKTIRRFTLIVDVDIDNLDLDEKALLRILQDDFNTFAESPDVEAAALRSFDIRDQTIVSLKTHGEFARNPKVLGETYDS